MPTNIAQTLIVCLGIALTLGCIYCFIWVWASHDHPDEIWSLDDPWIDVTPVPPTDDLTITFYDATPTNEFRILKFAYPNGSIIVYTDRVELTGNMTLNDADKFWHAIRMAYPNVCGCGPSQ